jgi:hypothetical protein
VLLLRHALPFYLSILVLPFVSVILTMAERRYKYQAVWKRAVVTEKVIKIGVDYLWRTMKYNPASVKLLYPGVFWIVMLNGDNYTGTFGSIHNEILTKMRREILEGLALNPPAINGEI